MPGHATSIQDIEDFLSQKRIAIVGVSRDPANLSRKLFEEFSRRGYVVVPVNPNLPELGGQTCYKRVQDVQPPVDTVLLMIAPEVTNDVVRDCAEAGVKRIWMYRAGGKGSVNETAVQFCQEKGIRVVPGECPYMFLPDAGGVHRFHGFVRKITGRFPQRANP